MSYGRRVLGGWVVELCDECGFDAQDCADELARLAAVYALLMALAEHPESDRSPGPGVWSAAEYLRHWVDMTRETVTVALAPGAPEGGPGLLDLRAAAVAADALVSGPGPADRHREIPLQGALPVPPEWMTRHLMYDLEHHLLDVRRGFAALALADSAGATVDRRVRWSSTVSGSTGNQFRKVRHHPPGDRRVGRSGWRDQVSATELVI